MNKVITFGGQGMVGSRIIELLQSEYEFINPSAEEIDITHTQNLEKFLSTERPQVVVNFAAITDVDYCETERENTNGIVWKVNALAPKTISALSEKLGYFFIQISTDMVFPGNTHYKGPYSENDKPGEYNDLTWYGASKAEGEKQVFSENPKNAVVRIIYPVRASFPEKLDYARKILALYDQGKLYPMFDDQIISITFVDELAYALKEIINRRLGGVFHVSSSDTTTPYEFANWLLEKSRNVSNILDRSSIEEFIGGKDKRRYPQYGGLDPSLTGQALSIDFSPWKEIVDHLSPHLQT